LNGQFLSCRGGLGRKIRLMARLMRRRTMRRLLCLGRAIGTSAIGIWWTIRDRAARASTTAPTAASATSTSPAAPPAAARTLVAIARVDVTGRLAAIAHVVD
jgi:hypothetical protein